LGPLRGYITRFPGQLRGELREYLEMAADSEEVARKESGCAKKRLHVFSSYSETVMNPLPGYD
jgi:hypothetical protein